MAKLLPGSLCTDPFKRMGQLKMENSSNAFMAHLLDMFKCVNRHLSLCDNKTQKSKHESFKLVKLLFKVKELTFNPKLGRGRDRYSDTV